jgi:RNA-directed DNA polymerase
MLATKFNTLYTRYADDMTFSLHTRDDQRMRIASLIRFTKEIAKEYGYTLHQDKKLQLLRRRRRMLVTGIVVNDKLNLPRKTRRKIRAVRHHLKTGRTATMNEAQLRGWEALQAMIVNARPQTPPAPAT